MKLIFVGEEIPERFSLRSSRVFLPEDCPRSKKRRGKMIKSRRYSIDFIVRLFSVVRRQAMKRLKMKKTVLRSLFRRMSSKRKSFPRRSFPFIGFPIYLSSRRKTSFVEETKKWPLKAMANRMLAEIDHDFVFAVRSKLEDSVMSREGWGVGEGG